MPRAAAGRRRGKRACLHQLGVRPCVPGPRRHPRAARGRGTPPAGWLNAACGPPGEAGQADRAQARGGARAVLAALGANLGIAATKFLAFAITGSASMLAESVHSLADCGNQLLLLVGRSRSRRAETEQHQFGFGTERYFYGSSSPSCSSPWARCSPSTKGAPDSPPREGGLTGGGVRRARRRDSSWSRSRCGRPSARPT